MKKQKLILLCMDGLDPDYAKELHLSMPYEKTLTIPKSLYYGNKPHTMNIWGSMFAGKEFPHPKFHVSEVVKSRFKFRKVLHKIGIKWHRDGWNVKKERETHLGDGPGKVHNAHVPYEDTIFHKYNSFIFDIPGVVDGFILGGSLKQVNRNHKLFKVLLTCLTLSSYELIAIYTHQPDIQAHMELNSDSIYKEGFFLANDLSKDNKIILLSDHGCSPYTHNHTELAYIGTNFPFEAETVLDVKDVIQKAMDDMKK